MAEDEKGFPVDDGLLEDWTVSDSDSATSWGMLSLSAAGSLYRSQKSVKLPADHSLLPPVQILGPVWPTKKRTVLAHLCGGAYCRTSPRGVKPPEPQVFVLVGPFSNKFPAASLMIPGLTAMYDHNVTSNNTPSRPPAPGLGRKDARVKLSSLRRWRAYILLGARHDAGLSP
jgi:hypothetical protein